MDAHKNTSCVQKKVILKMPTSGFGYDINPLLPLFAGAERRKGQNVLVLLLSFSLTKYGAFLYFTLRWATDF